MSIETPQYGGKGSSVVIEYIIGIHKSAYNDEFKIEIFCELPGWFIEMASWYYNDRASRDADYNRLSKIIHSKKEMSHVDNAR